MNTKSQRWSEALTKHTYKLGEQTEQSVWTMTFMWPRDLNSSSDKRQPCGVYSRNWNPSPWSLQHREMVFRLDKNLPPIKNVKGKVVSTRKQWEKKKEKATYTLYLYVRLSQRRGGRQGGSRKSGLGQLFICSWLPGVSGWSFSICHYSSLEVLGLPACVFRTGWKREREKANHEPSFVEPR